jgi:hypothetical protein
MEVARSRTLNQPLVSRAPPTEMCSGTRRGPCATCWLTHALALLRRRPWPQAQALQSGAAIGR